MGVASELPYKSMVIKGFSQAKQNIGVPKSEGLDYQLWIRDFLLYVTNISIAWWITLLLQGPIRSPFSLLLLCLRWERKPSLKISSISCTSQTGMYVCRSHGSQIVTSWSSQTVRLKRTACLVRDIQPVSLV